MNDMVSHYVPKNNFFFKYLVPVVFGLKIRINKEQIDNTKTYEKHRVLVNKVNNKDTRITSLPLFWRFYC